MKFRYVPLWMASALSITVACEHAPTDGAESSPEPATPSSSLEPASLEPEATASPADENNAASTPDDLVPAEQNVATRRMSASNILGRTRRELEAQVGPANGAQEDWAHYDGGGGFDVQFLGNEGRASRVRYVLTENRCIEAARAIGFGGAGPPLRRRERCEWPGQSRRHRLGPGVSGRLLFDMGVFEVWPR